MVDKVDEQRFLAQPAQRIDARGCGKIGQGKTPALIGVEPIPQKDADQHDAKPGDEGKIVDCGVAGRLQAQPYQGLAVDGDGRHNGAQQDQNHAQDEVRRAVAQQGIGQEDGKADEVEDAELHITVAHDQPGDRRNQQAQGHDFETPPQEFREKRSLLGLSALHAPEAEGERQADEQDEGVCRHALEIVPETVVEIDVPPGEGAQVPGQMVDHHHDDGDTAQRVDLPVALARDLAPTSALEPHLGANPLHGA